MIIKKFRAMVAVIGALSTLPAFAVFNDNILGVVAAVTVYADGDYIYFRLENQPASHAVCNPTYFVIPEQVPENRRNQMYARLLAAKATGESVYIGFDNAGNCVHGYIQAHRVG